MWRPGGLGGFRRGTDTPVSKKKEKGSGTKGIFV